VPACGDVCGEIDECCLERRDDEDMALHKSTTNTAQTITKPPITPTRGKTKLFSTVSSGRDAEDEVGRERVKANEGGFGHPLEVIPWAEHAAEMTDENSESTNAGLRLKAASSSARTAPSAFEAEDVSADLDTSTDTSTRIGDRA
jgi:hypothetical protein